jgi:hypothetical protein
MPLEREHVHLSVDQVAAHLERRLRGAERESVVAHLVECDECRREYIEAGAVAGSARGNWIGLRAGASVGLVAAAAITFAIMSPSSFRTDAGVIRGGSAERVAIPDAETTIRLATPSDGERLTGNTVRLAWHPNGFETLYRVTVQTADGEVLWKSSTHDTTVTVPSTVRLTAGETFYWIVDALQADGQPAHSQANAFVR